MITLYSGIPGSGKSYKMVAQLDRVKSKYYIVHNIDGLDKNYLGKYGIDFIKYCEEHEIDVIDFLSKDYQTNFTAAVKDKYDRPCLVIVDESHEWFQKKSKQLIMWLSYHRHLNQEIWLVAHKSTNIPSIYRSFIELEYRAKSGSVIGVPGFFLYNKISGGVPCGYSFERKKQAIFNIYKSQNGLDHIQKKNPITLIVLLLVVVCLVGAFLYLPQYAIRGQSRRQAEAEAKKPLADRLPVKSQVYTPEQIAGLEKAEREGVPFKINHPAAGFSPAVADPVKQVPMTVTEKYAYVGYLGKEVLLESRRDGRQVSLSLILPHSQIKKTAGIDFVEVYDRDSKQVLLFTADDRLTHFPADSRGGTNASVKE